MNEWMLNRYNNRENQETALNRYGADHINCIKVTFLERWLRKINF